jgi:hypothetical protein
MNVEETLRRIEEKLDRLLDISGGNKSGENWMPLGQAELYLDRRRTWFKQHMTEETGNEVHGKLVRGVDWERRGSRLYFRQSSLDKLLVQMEIGGRSYDEKMA